MGVGSAHGGECLTGGIEEGAEVGRRHVREDGEQPIVAGPSDRGRAALFGKGPDKDAQHAHRDRFAMRRTHIPAVIEIEHRDRQVLRLSCQGAREPVEDRVMRQRPGRGILFDDVEDRTQIVMESASLAADRGE